MSPVDLVDHETGEVSTLSDAEAQSLADSIARELLEIAPTLAEAIADAEALDRRRLHLERELARLGIARADGGSAWAVLEPPLRGSQRVSGQVATRYREELLALGLGEERVEFRPPAISAVRAARADLIAAGIDLDELAPEPVPGPPRVKLVPKASA